MRYKGGDFYLRCAAYIISDTYGSHVTTVSMFSNYELVTFKNELLDMNENKKKNTIFING